MNQLNEEKNKNKKLLEDLNKEKKNVNELNDKIKKYEELIKSKNKEIKELKKFNDSININEDKNISNLDKDIIIKKLQKDIDELKNKLSLYPFELSKGEKLISVIISSSDENILYSIICKNTEKFSKLEEKLYKDNPEYSNFDNYFMINGNRVDKMKTLDENKIKNGSVIFLKKNKTNFINFK